MDQKIDFYFQYVVIAFRGSPHLLIHIYEADSESTELSLR